VVSTQHSDESPSKRTLAAASATKRVTVPVKPAAAAPAKAVAKSAAKPAPRSAAKPGAAKKPATKAAATKDVVADVDVAAVAATGEDVIDPAAVAVEEVVAEGDEESAEFTWDDEEESEALRQARKDAEMTASADSVRAYLKQIGKVALLNAEEEVDLAKRIEAGLYAAERLRQAEETSATASGPRTTCSRRTSAWSCRWPSDTPAVAWRSSTSSRRATSA
jgi:RNA polymerase primary sigma factor